MTVKLDLGCLFHCKNTFLRSGTQYMSVLLGTQVTTGVVV
jgi:hypothetical protein